MLAANLDELREIFPGSLEATVVSAAPEWTVRRHAVRAVAITLSAAVDGNVEGWAAALETLHRRTACPLVFVPHAAAPDDDARLGGAPVEEGAAAAETSEQPPGGRVDPPA
jgi:hypothetical protein